MVRKSFKVFRVFFILFIIFLLVLFLYGKLSPKLKINNINNIVMYDKDGKEFFTGTGDKSFTSLKNISKYIKLSTISAEDKKFYKHHGFDIPRILKASLYNIKNKSLTQGASTISQQYVKNLFLDFDKTFKRKIVEALYTVRLESKYNKNEILEGYLNTINYGNGMYGVGKASKFYFGKDAKDLDLAESTILVSIPKSPSYYNPITHFGNVKRRQKSILNLMIKNGDISKREGDNAYNENVSIKGKTSEIKNKYMYYQNATLSEFKSIPSISKNYSDTKGLKIYTNLDTKAQDGLENSLKNEIKNMKDLEGAGVILRPDTGKIIALVGGKDYNVSTYNRAVKSKRQVGSTMKTYLYYAALENGFTTSSQFISAKTSFNLGNDNSYTVHNYNDKYADKPISMAAAVAYSDNIYAVKTNLFLGPDQMINVAKRVGIDAKLDAVPSLPLGTSEINLIDMAGGYSAFANLGKKIEPHIIEKIVDGNGNIIYKNDDSSNPVLNSSIVYILNNMLTCTYDPNFIDYNYPSAISLNSRLKHKYAVKSGTTDSDSLYIGYNKDILTAIWLGYDDSRDIPKISLKTQNIWYNATEPLEEGKTDVWYKKPSNLNAFFVDPISGNIVTENTKKKKLMYFIKGTEPTGTIKVFDEDLN